MKVICFYRSESSFQDKNFENELDVGAPKLPPKPSNDLQNQVHDEM